MGISIFIRFSSVSSFDSTQLMTHDGFTGPDSNQLMTQNRFLKFDLKSTHDSNSCRILIYIKSQLKQAFGIIIRINSWLNHAIHSQFRMTFFLAFNFTVDLVDLFGPFDSGVDFIWPYFTFIFYVERPISKFDLRSGQVKVRSTSGHDRSRSIRISSEAAWRAESFGTICTSLSPPIVIYWQKQDFDLIWPQVTSPWPPIISCVLIITDGVSVHDSERIGWFRLVYVKREAFSYFLIGL